MAVKHVPLIDQFVIHAEGSLDRLAARLAKAGEVQRIPGQNALLLRVSAKSGGAKESWDRVRALVGADGSVQPMLADEDGEPHYPSGEITVRFLEAPSEDVLSEFAAQHGLTLLRRTPLAPQQAVFQQAGPKENYLPEIVEELDEAPETKAAWANTFSHYRRI